MGFFFKGSAYGQECYGGESSSLNLIQVPLQWLSMLFSVCYYGQRICEKSAFFSFDLAFLISALEEVMWR